MKRNNKKGFTIVELVIVIAVIAILSAVLIPTFGSVTKKAQDSAAQQEVKNVHTLYIASIDYAAGKTAETIYVAHENGVYTVATDGKITKSTTLTATDLADGAYVELDIEDLPTDVIVYVVCTHVDAEKDAAEGTEGKDVCDNCGADLS